MNPGGYCNEVLYDVLADILKFVDISGNFIYVRNSKVQYCISAVVYSWVCGVYARLIQASGVAKEICTILGVPANNPCRKKEKKKNYGKLGSD